MTNGSRRRLSRRGFLTGSLSGLAAIGLAGLGFEEETGVPRLATSNVGGLIAGRSPPRGPALITTIDSGLQLALHRAMDGGVREAIPISGFVLRGAAVLIDPSTGEILAMDSRPSYGVDEFSDDRAWARAEAADRRAYFGRRRLNRVLEGLYPPGSTFKAVTAIAALESGLFRQHTPVFDYNQGERGPIEPDGQLHERRWHEIRLDDGSPISCGNHPDLQDWRFDLESAFAWSCNVAFAEIARTLGARRLVDAARRLGFERDFLAPGLGHFRSTLDNDALRPLRNRFLATSHSHLARTAFGQAQVLASPLHMALVASAIANGGRMMRPHLISGWRMVDGSTQVLSRPEALIHASLKSETVIAMQALMRTAGASGVIAGSSLVRVGKHLPIAAKTGSAQWSDDPTDAAHAWLIGYLPLEATRLAFAIVVERGGAGAVAAAAVLDHLLSSLAMKAYAGRGRPDSSFPVDFRPGG